MVYGGVMTEIERWDAYLEGLSNPHIKAFWGQVQQQMSSPPLPASIPAAEHRGGFQLAWDTDRYHLDVTIRATGSFDYFFDDLQTGVWAEGSSMDSFMCRLRQLV